MRQHGSLFNIKVEDFINTTSNTPMSSVPVQFLIHVLPIPDCPNAPELFVTTNCLDAQVGVPTSFEIRARNRCDPDDAYVSDILMSTNLPGIQAGNLVQGPNNSFASVTYTWTPRDNQLGSQIFCTTAFTKFFFQFSLNIDLSHELF